jgi:hypothetical protein
LPKIQEISIIFPIYNEERRIINSLENISKFLTKQSLKKIEIILVNDGSNDQTENNIKFFFNKLINKKIKYIKLNKNKGKGYALKKGILAAKYNWTLTCDIDLSVGLNQINTVANFILIELETVALGNYSQGAESLTGLNYTSNKNIYLFAVDSMLMYQEREIYAGLSSTQSICEALLFFAIILTIMSILMFIADGTRLLSELRLTGEKSASSQESGTSKVAPLAGIKVTPLIKDSKGE